jgi:hypothetical protein
MWRFLIMSRNKKKIKEQFMPVTKSLVRSQAWKDLPDVAIRVYILIYLDCKSYEFGKEKLGVEGGQLTYKQAEENGINRTKMKVAVDELISKGFIKMHQTGGHYHKHSYFSLSEDWKDYKGSK